MDFPLRLPVCWCVALLLGSLPPSLSGQEASSPTAPDAAALKFVESKIRPLLATYCVECHGEKKQKHNLRLDSLTAMLQGGDSGPAVVPYDLDASLLLRAVSYEEADMQMPPDGKLEDAQIEDLKKWITMGAPWPEAEAKSTRSSLRADSTLHPR